MALDILHNVSSLGIALDTSIAVRIGICTGPVVSGNDHFWTHSYEGVIGITKFAFDVWGDTVNVSSRMETSSPDGRI